METLNRKGQYNLHLNSTWDNGVIRLGSSSENFMVNLIVNDMLWIMHHELGGSSRTSDTKSLTRFVDSYNLQFGE